MNKKLLAAVVVLAAGSAAAGIVVARSRAQHRAHRPPPSAKPHAEGIDREMTSLRAMFEAPAGATPCDTAWNAFSAADEAAKRSGRTPLVLHLAPRDEFLARCRALPAEAQPCLAPAYSTRHRDDCLRVKPSAEVLKPMFEIKPPEGVQAGERDADRQFMSTRNRQSPSDNSPPAANIK